MLINTNYIKDLMQAFIDDSFYYAKDILILADDERAVKYEIKESRPLNGYISGEIFILNTDNNTTRNVYCEFRQSPRMKQKLADFISLNLVIENTFDIIDLSSSDKLSSILSDDIVVLHFIELYVVREVNTKNFLPYKLD